jgi:ribonuclease HI
LIDDAKDIVIYTDGACSGNPGPGGWGALLSWKGYEKEIFGGELESTNNRMELMATIQALEILKRAGSIALYTDSTYVRDGITKWIHAWKQNGWRTAAKKPVKNKDLWKRLEAALMGHNVEWYWVKGHSGHLGNERADQLARDGVLQITGGL